MLHRPYVALFAVSFCACSSVPSEPSAPVASEAPSAATAPDGRQLSVLVDVLIVEASREQRASFPGRSIDDIAADTNVDVIGKHEVIAQNHMRAQLGVEGLRLTVTPDVRIDDDVRLDIDVLDGPRLSRTVSFRTSVVVPHDETVVVQEIAQGERSRAFLVHAWVIRTNADLRHVIQRKLEEKVARERGAR
jgi:hypothetical protein